MGEPRKPYISTTTNKQQTDMTAQQNRSQGQDRQACATPKFSCRRKSTQRAWSRESRHQRRCGGGRWCSWLRGKSLSDHRARSRMLLPRGVFLLPSHSRKSLFSNSASKPPPAPFNSTTFLIDLHMSNDNCNDDGTWSSLEAETFSTA